MEYSVFNEDVAGLNIADNCITAARIKLTSKGEWEVRNAGWMSYDSSRPDKDLADKVRALWSQSGMPTRTVCSCIASPVIASHYFKFAKMSNEELESALWLQGEEMLQMPLGEIAIDWHLNRPVEDTRDPCDETTTEGILFAAPLKDVDRHLEILEMAGLFPVILDAGSMAISNLFVGLRDGDVVNGTTCLLNLSNHVADMAILRGEKWVYPHTVIFRTTTIEEAIGYLCESVNDVLKYCQYKLHHDPVTRLLVTGQIPLSDHFTANLQKGTGLPVEIWDPLPLMKVANPRLARRLAADQHIGPLLATSFGLALRRD